MRIFVDSDLVDGEMYFCVHESRVYYMRAMQDDTFSDLFAMLDYENRQLFYAHECELIYKL